MKRSIPPLIIHILIGLAFLALPYIFAPRGFSGLTQLADNPHERTNFLSYLFMLVFFYFNYYFLIPNLYLGRKYLLYVASVVGCFLVIIGMVLFLDRQDIVVSSLPRPNQLPEITGFEPGDLPEKPPFGFELSHALFLFLVGIFVSLFLQINNRWRLTEQEKLATELSYLKAQINPHFLFNTLNSIYSLAIEKSDRTADAVVKLSSLMRYVIRDAGSNQVPLAKEVDYISDYIALQKLRLDDTVQIEFAVSGLFNGKQIAPLILISFIENAFKYGVNPEEKSMIHITISLSANNLRLYVFNKKVRVYHNDEASGGIGIENTRARLQLMYPDQHVLTITDNPTGFAVELTITLA
ncbi:sensor histidine kinase [Larkinella terrae]|uniref:Sensor histidine kinase n=1 Tax=Larkinella terrae TaxID=2025311 RepID=A0A7K0ELY6_9BACT|nr:sensor histidine kinase [Larkinella terrae]MRS62438.1 sensor histidine kinase [Larkinella terrae]